MRQLRCPGCRHGTVNRLLASLLTLLLSIVTACAGSGNVALARADVPRVSADPAGAIEAGRAINAFGLDLYRRAGERDGNVVVSPASVALALAMARAGARGETAVEMDAVLHDVATDGHASWLNALDAALTGRSGTFADTAGKPQPVALRIANAPFSQRGMTLVKAYLEALASRFGAGLRLVDYAADPEAARRTINGWVADQTEQRIPELLVPGVITSDDRLTLVNAIYLKAPWLDAVHDGGATKPDAFIRADGTTVEVPMMAANETLPYAEGAGWRAVELPYVGGSLAMTIIVPEDDRRRSRRASTPSCWPRSRAGSRNGRSSSPSRSSRSRARSTWRRPSPRWACRWRSTPIRPTSPGSRPKSGCSSRR